MASPTDKPENPPAFACASENGHQEGMSLRDYFAGQALLHSLKRETDSVGTTFISAAAQNAYEIADAMLNERTKP